MSTIRSRTIAKILEQVSISGKTQVLEQTRRLSALEHQVSVRLPAEMAGHCRVAGFAQGMLRLAADSPAWAARIRYQSPALIEQLKQIPGLNPVSVQVRVLPAREEPRTPARKLSLTEENARLLQQTARTIRDPGLAQALARLARHKVKASR